MSISVEKLVNNDDFLAKLENAQNEEEVIALFKENGVEISADDLNDILSDGASGELDENSLDAVSGGAVGHLVGYAVAYWLRRKYFTTGGGGYGGGGGGGRRF